jgi:hypothetical protein
MRFNHPVAERIRNTKQTIRVERRGSYQGVPQYGITEQAEITPSRKTAVKWAALENARRLTKYS